MAPVLLARQAHFACCQPRPLTFMLPYMETAASTLSLKICAICTSSGGELASEERLMSLHGFRFSLDLQFLHALSELRHFYTEIGEDVVCTFVVAYVAQVLLIVGACIDCPVAAGTKGFGSETDSPV